MLRRSPERPTRWAKSAPAEQRWQVAVSSTSFSDTPGGSVPGENLSASRFEQCRANSGQLLPTRKGGLSHPSSSHIAVSGSCFQDSYFHPPTSALPLASLDGWSSPSGKGECRLYGYGPIGSTILIAIHLGTHAGSWCSPASRNRDCIHLPISSHRNLDGMATFFAHTGAAFALP